MKNNWEPAKLYLECFLTNPPKPMQVVVKQNGHFIATLDLKIVLKMAEDIKKYRENYLKIWGE